MKPLPQTRFGPNHGNRLAACVASLLDLGSAEDVPASVDPRDDELGRSQRLQLEEWLRGRGLGLVSVSTDGPLEVTAPAALHYMAWGRGKCGGCLHSVIYQGGELCHDPLPEGSGLVSVKELAFLVRLT